MNRVCVGWRKGSGRWIECVLGGEKVVVGG